MIPISTDAPLYHYPVATITTIVVNVVMFLAVGINPQMELIDDNERGVSDSDSRRLEQPPQGQNWQQVLSEEEGNASDPQEPEFDTEDDEPADENRFLARTGFLHRNLCLEFGTFKPWQWLTNNFMHAGWLHLLGNMVFLWAFGIVVEGKVGWLVFTAIYLAVGTIYGFLLQILTLIVGMDHGMALGASAAIFGLLAICVAWAPANEFEILWFFGLYGGLSEISILTYGAFFFVKEFLFLGIQGFQMSSELLHIMGFLLALPVGLWMVKAGHVNCEGWDIFSYLQGRTGQDSKLAKQAEMREKEKRKKLATQNSESSPSKEQNVALLQAQVTEALGRGEIDLAHRLHIKLATNNPSIQWKQNELHQIVSGYLKARRYTEAANLIPTYIELFDCDRFAMQIALLRIWLSEQKPRKVLKYIKGMNIAFLGPEHTEKLKPILEHAKKMIEAGVIEIQND